MSYSKSDNFLRADASPIAGNWNNLALSTYVTARLISHEMKNVSTGSMAYYFDDGSTPPDDQYVEVQLSSLADSSSYLAALARVATTGGGQGYVGYIGTITLGSTVHVGIQKIIGGVKGGDLAAATSAGVVQLGSRVGIMVTASGKITVYLDGLATVSYTDTSSPLTSGKGGVFIYTPTSANNIGLNLWNMNDAGVRAYSQPTAGYGHIGAFLDTMQCVTRRNKGFVLGNVPLIGGARGKNNGQIYP